jgi:hypothetical protein
MIKSNRVIQTTIFVVFLFVVLSLPIFNKPGVIFVQAAPYIQCTVDNLNGKFQNDWEQMCNILMGVHATTDFYRTGGSQLVGLEYYADCSNLKDTHGKSITAVMLSDAISKVCPIKEGANYNGNQKTALTNLCNYCSDPVKYADVFHNTKSLAAPTEQEYKQQQAEVPSSGGIPGENIPSWEPKSTEEGYCLLTDKNGVLLNKDPSPCALPFDIGWLNPLNSATGGLLYIIYLILRGVLVVILKVFQWLLNPLNFGGYINFLNFNPSSSNPSLVPQLWSFIKNFANLGIILGMIFTAIATILRIEKYSWKKMLPKLLLVALLVNFSLVIAGIFVDISSYIVNVTATSFNNISLSNLVVNCSLCPTVKAFYNLEGSWNLVRATGLGLILSALFFYQFIGLVFYVFIRILTIVICLITSPLAFLSFAFPGGEKVWDFWRKQFQQAIVILPVLCIVFVLSLQFINIIVSNLNNNIKSGDEGAFVIVLAYAGFVIVFAQLVRYVANFLGVEQVEKGFQMAKKAATTLAMAGVAAVGGIAIPKIMESKAYQKVGEGLTHVAPLRGLGQKMMVQGEIEKKRRLEQYEKEGALLSKATLQKVTEETPPNPLIDKKGYERWQGYTNARADKGDGLAENNIDWVTQHSDDPGFNLKAISTTRADLVKMNPDKTARQKLVRVKDDVESAVASIASHKVEDIIKYMDGSAVIDNFEKKGKLNDFVSKQILAFPQPSQIAAFWKSIDPKDKAPVTQGGKDYYAKFVTAVKSNTNALKKFNEALISSKPLREDFGKNIS